MSRRTKRIATWVFVLLVVVFFALYLRDVDYDTLGELSFDWTLIGLATLISLAFRYWGVFIWRTILSDLGARRLPSFHALSDVYGKAWMARYIPGTVAWLAGKVYLAGELGISRSRLMVSTVLEAGMQIIASFVVAFAVLAVDPRLDVVGPQIKWLMVALVVAGLLVLLPPVFNRLAAFGFRFVLRRRVPDDFATNGRATLKSFLLYVGGSFIAGLAYFFLAKSLYPPINAADDLWFIIGAFTLAGALGMATPLVPSGLGVRDGVQLVMLSVIMPKELALALTIASRLWSAVVDVLFFLTAQGWHRLAVRLGGESLPEPEAQQPDPGPASSTS